MKEFTENVWVANIVSAGVILTVLSWLLQRFIKSYDQRLEEVEENSDEIKKNYIRRFEEVNDKIDDTREELKEHFTREIKEVIRDKSDHRERQAREMGVISTKIDNLNDYLKNNKRP